MFFTIELAVDLFLLWLGINVIRYWFFKDKVGGGIFSLSDRWIALEKEVKSETKKK